MQHIYKKVRGGVSAAIGDMTTSQYIERQRCIKRWWREERPCKNQPGQTRGNLDLEMPTTARQKVATRQEGERRQRSGHMAMKGWACDGSRGRQNRGCEHINQSKERCAGHMATKCNGWRRRNKGLRQLDGPSNAVFSVASQPQPPLDASTVSFLLACILQHDVKHRLAGWKRHCRT